MDAVAGVASSTLCHSLSYWSILMTSPVEFLTGEFRIKNGKKSPLKWHNQPGQNERLLESLIKCIWIYKFITRMCWL